MFLSHVRLKFGFYFSDPDLVKHEPTLKEGMHRIVILQNLRLNLKTGIRN